MTDYSPIERIEMWQETLQEQGCRLTDARRAVMNILATSKTALSPQEIYDITRDNGLSLGIASVYRTLEMLAGFNLIQQIHQPGGCQAYWPTLVGHQHLMLCETCGRVVVFEGMDDLNNLFQKVEEKSGYQVQEHWLQLFGICEQCQ